MSDRLAKEFPCGIHNIRYLAFKPGCPVCDAERQVINLREAVKELKDQNKILHDHLVVAQLQVDAVSAYRTSSQLLDDNDRAFYKEVLYMFRDESSVSLRPLMDERRIIRDGARVSKRIPVGIIVVPRGGEAWGHECTSIGGSSIAQIFEENVNGLGTIQATKMMVRGLAGLLPGRVR